MTWYWISWADKAGTPDAVFLGVNIVQADSATEALVKTNSLHICPGANDWLPAPYAPVECAGQGMSHAWHRDEKLEKLVCANCGKETDGERQPHGEHGIVELPHRRDVPDGSYTKWNDVADRLLSEADLLSLGLIVLEAT